MRDSTKSFPEWMELLPFLTKNLNILPEKSAIILEYAEILKARFDFEQYRYRGMHGSSSYFLHPENSNNVAVRASKEWIDRPFHPNILQPVFSRRTLNAEGILLFKCEVMVMGKSLPISMERDLIFFGDHTLNDAAPEALRNRYPELAFGSVTSNRFVQQLLKNLRRAGLGYFDTNFPNTGFIYENGKITDAIVIDGGACSIEDPIIYKKYLKRNKEKGIGLLARRKDEEAEGHFLR